MNRELARRIGRQLEELKKEMDPNETLQRLRQLTSLRTPVSEETQQEIVSLFDALDDWLTTGGFLPEVWDWRWAHR